MSTFQDHLGILMQGSLTIEKLWELARFSPNDEQREAILHVDGPLYLTAGPGSGKTRVLLWRTLNLIVFHDVQPEEIFLSTFTEKASHKLTEGLRSLLGMVTNWNGQPYDLGSMYIGTVHSLCRRMLTDRRRFFFDRQRHQLPTLMDALAQYFHLSRTRTWNEILSQGNLDPVLGNSFINQIFNRNSQSKHQAVVNCQSIFNRFSEELIDPDQSLVLLSDDDSNLRAFVDSHDLSLSELERLLQLYRAYLRSLQDRANAPLTDFALLQQEAFRVLTDSQTTGQTFKHVIVDEYQDTNTIQEKIYFRLAGGWGNICVVGDDDQALYRFRGATVENFVEFPARCQYYFGKLPRRISLETNYRSRKSIVDFYTSFVAYTDWVKGGEDLGHYRIMDKNIHANRAGDLPAVVACTPDVPEQACAEVAHFIRRLIDDGKVENPNQVAVLFPSMKYRGDMVKPVARMKNALEAVGLEVYAPRAGRFLEVDEAFDIFGLFIHIFGRQGFRGRGHDVETFRKWLTHVQGVGESLMRNDPRLTAFVKDRKNELNRVINDYQVLLRIVKKKRWDLKSPYDISTMKRVLINAAGLSGEGKRLLSSAYLDRVVEKRAAEGCPHSLIYILRRVTSIDWNVLDLFYQLCGFEHFRKMFDLAETQGDEGPVANLGLITQYLQRFIDERIPLITADLLVENIFQQVFFNSYLFSLYRLGETELEDFEDPFPKGRIPFLTIHQAKGLEFPVVVLGNLRKDDKGPNRVEVITRSLLSREPGEPLERMTEFDITRMFYVALSRAKNLLVLTHYRGRGQRTNQPFQEMLDNDFPRLAEFDLETVPASQDKDEDLPRAYSFTSDYLLYRKCPRQYMIFRKFGFVPSRAQTMFFGSLVHRTLEDLHHELIRRREQQK